MPIPPPSVESYVQVRATASEGASPGYAVRRFRVTLRGAPDPKTAYLVQFFDKTGNRSPSDEHVWVQDASWKRKSSSGTWTLGQFRPALGRQRLTGDRELIVLERATVSDALIPSGGFVHSFARDFGAQWEPKLSAGHALSVGLFRGSGALQESGVGDGNPLLAVRGLRTFTHLEMGVALSGRENRSRNFSRALPGLTNFSGWDARTSLEAGYHSKGWRGSAELLTARFFGTGSSPRRTARGGYLEAGRKVGKYVEVAGMAQFFDPDTSKTDAADTWGWTLGIGLLPPSPKDRWQLNYVARRERLAPKKNDQLQLQYQRYLTR